jgi:hypothetical protein
MPELRLPEDEAALYVLGALNAHECREFKARLAESAELRGLVRELEEGAVAMAFASPVKRAPQKIWTAIEKAVGKEARPASVQPVFRNAWWRNGWAAAACLAACLFYVVWVNRSRTDSRLTAMTSDPGPRPTAAHANSPQANKGELRPPNSDKTAIVRELLRASEQNANELRTQISNLQNRVNRQAQLLTLQQSWLSQTNRLKFVQLTPSTNGGQSAAPAPLSPDLQYAISVAMARELGWLPAANGNSKNETAGSTFSTMTTYAGVDFADFRPGTNNAANPPKSFIPPENQSAEVTATPPPVPASAPTPVPDPTTTPAPAGAIPAFISGNSLIMAIDSTIAAKGSQLSFSTGAPGQDQQVIGSTVLGDNPTVVAVPIYAPSGDTTGNAIPTGISPDEYPTLFDGTDNGTWGLTVTSGTAYGISNLFQYYVTNPPAPAPTATNSNSTTNPP